MGAGCCRAHILPGGPGGHRAPGPPPRPAWGPAWGTTAPDHSIASLRPGDKFHFHREPFIRQHLVVPDKPFSANGHGVHNKAYTSDVGELTVRPALPSLPTPPSSPAPVPPPRKKRRARSAQPHGLPGAPPQPPSRTRAGSRPRDDGADAEGGRGDSILSPANTMELLQRMAKADSRVGARRPGPAWRSMDSLDAVEVRGRSLPGHGALATASRTTAASQYLAQSAEALDGLDGPRSLDLDLNREGVVGVAAFTLQSWEERGHGSARPWSPPLSTSSSSAALLSPRHWRPLSPPTASAASPEPEADAPHQAARATTRAMSEFIRDSYTAGSGDSVDAAASVTADPAGPAAAAAVDSAAVVAEGTEALPGQRPHAAPEVPEVPDAAAHAVAAARSATATEEEGLQRDGDQDSRPLTPSPAATPAASDAVPAVPAAKKAGLLDVAAADVRPASAASSTTESLGELENDILHMLSTSGSASARTDTEEDDEDKEAVADGRVDPVTTPADVQQQQQQQQQPHAAGAVPLYT